MAENVTTDDELVRIWVLPHAARLGSSVRSKGLFLEMRSLLPKAAQKSLSVRAGELSLRMPKSSVEAFSEAAAVVSRAMAGIEDRPVKPREIEDILGITTTERRRWLADGRLPSCGTRTAKLRGRAKITFHVFDPRVVEDILDRNVIDGWREEDAETAAENRRRAAWKAKLTRAQGRSRPASASSDVRRDEDGVKLRGWAEFFRNGPLR